MGLIIAPIKRIVDRCGKPDYVKRSTQYLGHSKNSIHDNYYNP